MCIVLMRNHDCESCKHTVKTFHESCKNKKRCREIYSVTCIDCAKRMNMDEKEIAMLFNLKTKRAEPSVRK